VSPSILDLIDFRAFSSIWYWLFLGLIWTRVIHAPFGVPYDLLRQADRNDVQAGYDVAALTAIEMRHRDQIAGAVGVWAVAAWAFGLTLLAVLGLAYGLESAQALFVIAAPLAVVQVMTARTHGRIRAQELEGRDLRQALRRLRGMVQGIGMVSVFFSALWGMIRLLEAQSF
jgi:hypothetical protein